MGMEESHEPTKPTEPIPEPSYDTTLKEILARQSLMDDIFAHIANGGNMITFAENLKIRYSDIAAWLMSDPDRYQIMQKAFQAGDEWIRVRVLNELKHIALTDLRMAYNASGTLKNPQEWPESIARAIMSVETDELYAGVGKERERVGDTRKVKFMDKIKALELIGKEKGLFMQKVKVEGKISLEEIVAGSFDDQKP